MILGDSLRDLLLGNPPKKPKIPIDTKDRHTDVAEHPRHPQTRRARMPAPFSEPWSSENVSQNKVSLFWRPSVVPRTAQLRSYL